LTFESLPWETDIRFQACLPYTLKEEGGYSNDPHDPGGATMEGITQREYSAYLRRKGLPMQAVRGIDRSQRDEIYYTSYWMPHCFLMPIGVDLVLFDNSVNEGPVRGMMLLQMALGVAADGFYGPITANAVATQDHDNPIALLQRYDQDREHYYRELSTFRYFGRDWIGRAERITRAAIAMLPKS
jgi:lysozyme family protein